jgi:hypothetical protein
MQAQIPVPAALQVAAVSFAAVAKAATEISWARDPSTA